MAETILRPNGVGDLNDHKQLPDVGEHWQKVDEEIPNDGADYVYGASTVGTYDLYTIEPHGLPAGTVINKITLHGRFYRGSAPIGFNAVVGWLIKTLDETWAAYTGGGLDAWYTDSLDLPLNPISELPWTLDDLTNLQIGTGLAYAFGAGVDREGRNTQLYIVVTYTPAIVAPTVTTDAATLIGTTSATLNGTLDNDGGAACACGFEWGETIAYEHGATPTDSKTTGQSFSQVITGLDPNTTYHFRALATNSAGTSNGADRTFTTNPLPPDIIIPTVTTNPASAISQVSATLNGILHDDGGEACQVRFQYGLTNAYGTDTTWQPGKVTGHTFEQTISGLEPNTTYHFRAQAKNSAGTASGADRTFTTQVAVIVNKAYALAREEL